MPKLPTGNRASRIRSNVAKRQELKKKWDKHCKYEAGIDNESMYGFAFSANYQGSETENWTRLLDEGVVVDGDGYAYAVIAKGTLKAFFDSLNSSFVGYINKDHTPAIGLGKFTKDDIKLVELDNGRYGLDVNVKLDDELYAVKDLKREMNRKALSAEFYADAEEYVTAESVTGDKSQGKYLVPIINAIKLEGYAVVDNPKNANSYDENLLEKASASEELATNNFERNDMPEEEIKVEQTEEVTVAAEEEVVEAAAEEVTETAQEEAVETPAEEEVAEESTEDVKAEEAVEEPAEESAEEEVKEEAEPAESETADKLAAAIAELKEQLAAKDAKIAELEAKLSVEEQKEESFEARMAKLLSFATSEEPTVEEGSETTTDNNEGESDAYTAALKDAFTQM